MPKIRSLLVSLAAGVAAALALTQPPQDARAAPPIAEELAGAPLWGERATPAPALNVAVPAAPPSAPAPATVADVAPSNPPASGVGPVDAARAAVGDLTMFLFAAAIALGVVRFARGYFPGVLAPTPSTHRSKALCRTLALVTGLGLGAAGIAPSVGTTGLAGALAGGFLAAAVAVYGRDSLTSGWKAMTAADDDA